MNKIIEFFLKNKCNHDWKCIKKIPIKDNYGRTSYEWKYRCTKCGEERSMKN